VTTLNNPTPGSDEEFGNSVAVSGNTVVVAAPYDDTGATDNGQAYGLRCYEKGALLATLNSPAPRAGASFGYSVAAFGKTPAVVGAYLDVTGGQAVCL